MEQSKHIKITEIKLRNLDTNKIEKFRYMIKTIQNIKMRLFHRIDLDYPSLGP
jgi:hypothetical protein